MNKKILFLVTLILLITYDVYMFYNKKGSVNEIEKPKEEVQVAKELTVANLLEELKINNIKHPDVVLRQSIMESGWFKCTSCSMRYNNPFGFRHPSWIDNDNPLGYLKFDLWQDAVKYYKKWQKKRYKGGDYYEFLVDIGYAEDPKYIDKLKSLNI